MIYKSFMILCSLIMVIRAPLPETVSQVSNIPGILKTTTTLRPPEDAPKNCAPCKCGEAPYSPARIVNGTECTINKFPWMVALLYMGNFYCGGTSINDLYVLTAAHCASGFIKRLITARFLEHDLTSSSETNAIDRKIVATIIHPLFVRKTLVNDIALLKLDQRINFSVAPKKPNPTVESSSENEVEVRPVCMPEPDLSYDDYDGIVIGWGHTTEGGERSDTLQEVHVPVLSNEECNRDYGGTITDNMVCAGPPEGGSGACQGDSGGPLHIFDTDDHVYRQIGVVSAGTGCARPNKPAIFTRISEYMEWIHDNTEDACYCD